MPLPVPAPPVIPLVVLRAFTPAPEAWMPAHRGVDLRAGAGQPVRAIRAGTVVFAERLADRPVVVLRSNGVRFTYEPVSAAVPVGSRVAAGQQIGTVATGWSLFGPLHPPRREVRTASTSTRCRFLPSGKPRF
ncbi:MAG: M23 family metallopeptidase [Candidatus Nanopelagicales bacterium]